jgi:cell division inhibitor SepF
MGIFNKNNKTKDKKTLDNFLKPLTSTKIILEKLTTDESDYLVAFADQLISGCPLILNFSGIDIDQANKAIAFFSGVSYAVKGNVKQVNEKTFLFTEQYSFEDGSLDEWLKEIN